MPIFFPLTLCYIINQALNTCNQWKLENMFKQGFIYFLGLTTYALWDCREFSEAHQFKKTSV
jgi:hypothetical protein